MAVYSKLLLSTGGGIISAPQQAAQTKNTATVLIGLGGTGIDCIRTIKTQVYSRLRPDDVNSVVPTYSHIRFLGVDTASESKGDAIRENHAERQNRLTSLAALEDGEFFSIANANIAQVFRNPAALERKTEFDWLMHEQIEPPNLSDAGAGGLRQVGRFMMMDRSEDFLVRIGQEIQRAKEGLVNPRLNIHIFAGLSGGTGSGCFLDVCYMVRSVVEKTGSGTIFGYFFLPDVNLAKIPPENKDTRNYIPQNGYAAMQELDYCMDLHRNGGRFFQEYQGHQMIPWENAPVDMCHLICATDKNNNVIKDAYEYAMNVTAEYIMDFLTDSIAQFDLTQHLSNFRNMINQADNKKVIGSKTAYCVIGASCASIPLREINTYLASELFNRFAQIKENIPTAADVEKLVFSAFAPHAQSIQEVYEALLDSVRRDVSSDYDPYPDNWQFVRDNGNSDLLLHYTNQTGAKLNRMEANFQSMTDTRNTESLLKKVERELSNIIRDIDRGPIFAYRLLSAAESHNLLNIIDGLLKENESRKTEEALQGKLRSSDHESARRNFEDRASSLFGNQKRFGDYEYYLGLDEQHKLAGKLYDKMDDLLINLRKQIVHVTANRYIKLQRVMETLLNTFKENRDLLQSEKALYTKSTFAVPMMTIDELKPSLDEEIARLNISGMLDAFMTLLADNESAWIGEDPSKITRLVTDFFVNTAFSGFADRSITSFLKDKYEGQRGEELTDGQLANLIYEDWMKLLTGRASPLFYFNSSVWKEADTSKLAFLSFPAISGPIKSAAIQMNATSQMWGLKESALTDRIYVMCSACGLPLSSYNNCTEYEEMYFSTKAYGRHYYEGKKVRGIPFDNWNLLPPITPQSIMNLDRVKSGDLRDAVSKVRTLYEQASRHGLIDSGSKFYAPDPASAAELEERCSGCEAILQQTDRAGGIPELEKALEGLDLSALQLRETGFALPEDGHRKDEDIINKIREDHFAASPAVHDSVRESVACIEALAERIDTIKRKAQERIDTILASAGDIKNYCDAIFTGVISIEMYNVAYRRDEDVAAGEDCVYLSQRTSAFPHGGLPLYQGYITFQQLPVELKREIQEKVESFYTANASCIRETGKRLLEDELSNKRFQTMRQIALGKPQEKEEIFAFLDELKQAFRNFCLENGL